MGLFKWWKNKNAVILITVGVLAVVLSALATIFIPEPYNWIVLGVLIVSGGITMRIYLFKVLKNLVENDDLI
jgi:uncharacterized membrane protein HdeD (DUF308 family)